MARHGRSGPGCRCLRATLIGRSTPKWRRTGGTNCSLIHNQALEPRRKLVDAALILLRGIVFTPE
jgi:hypothetical protein